MHHWGTNATGLRNQASPSIHLKQRLLLILIALQTAFWLPYANAQEGDPSREHQRRERERERRRENPPPRDTPRERPEPRPEPRPRPEPPRERPEPRPEPRPRPEPPRERPEPRPRPEPPRPDPRPRPEPPRPRPEPPRPGPDRERERRERERREREERDRWDRWDRERREREERERRDREERDRWDRERREREERDRWDRERREREEREREERERREREPRTPQDDVLAYEVHSFRYSKPHEDMMWNVSATDGALLADQLVISSNGTGGMKGTNGIAGISQAVVYYTDGTLVDLVAQAKRMGDPHYRAKSGQLAITSEFDEIVLLLNSSKAVHAVYIKADSWINVNTPVELVFSLEATGLVAPLR